MATAVESKDTFHQNSDLAVTLAAAIPANQQFRYRFENFFHPFVGDLIKQLNTKSIVGLMDADEHKKWTTPFFEAFYDALKSDLVAFDEFPKKEIDVSSNGPYANYNWELLFHFPFAIAVHLSKNRRFAEAQRWFHYIFDPTDTTQQYWKFLAFREIGEVTPIDRQLMLLSKGTLGTKLREALLDSYEQIRNYPFQPHPVAQLRVFPYQYAVVMKYLDNLITWGDSLFRLNTIESINEATQIYVLAANILGARPQRIPPRGTIRPKTFHQLKLDTDHGLDEFSNALVELEGQFPFSLGPASTSNPDATGAFGSGQSLYFCIPPNDKLLGYWDIVADRLFKIRHCMNIEGVVRQLALFDPPIDPGMLVKAAAAGIDIGSIVSGLNQPLGPVRCPTLIQKALELCGEVRSLGSALLSALGNGDGEHLALLRQGHEIKIQQMMQDVRFLQWKQAQEATKSLLTTRATALERLRYYQRLLGLPADQKAPDTLTLDPSVKPDDPPKLNEDNFDEAYNGLVGQYEKTLTLQEFPELKKAGDLSPGIVSGYSGSGKVYLSENEDTELNTHLPAARDARLIASAANMVASSLSPIPDTDVKGHYWGIGVSATVTGGEKLAIAAKIVAEIAQITAAWEQDQAGMTARYASYERRADEWLLQYNLAAHELMQLGRQVLTSLIAEQIAHHEYHNIKQQIVNAQEVDQFLHDKFTNEELYVWMQGEISRLYYEYYRFAFDTARKAERTMKQELMRPELDAQDFVKFNYWDGGRKGLLSGEALYLDIKRMEMAYQENNKREFELTKHVSLRQLNPALLNLKATGTCEVTVPEWLYDLDCPGHYMRRIKTVSLSIPSVAGPYTSVSCTLSLLKSSLRKSPLLADGEYPRQGSEDNRFVDYFGTIQSTVTSSGNNDNGMFETNLSDPRFLHFEGAGAESKWKLELPAAFRQFDYNTISDVILHIRYSARQGGAQLRDKAVEHLKALVAEVNTSGLALLFSLRHEFPTEWHRFINGTEDFKATIKRDHFPYFTKGGEITIEAVQLHAIQGDKVQPGTPQGLVLTALTEALNDESQAAFVLSLAPDSVLERKKEASVFLSIKYSLTS